MNTSGRICHSIFSRDWSPATSVVDVFNQVYSLLLAPDFEHALNANLAMTLYKDPVEYREMVNPKGTTVSKPRGVWRAELG